VGYIRLPDVELKNGLMPKRERLQYTELLAWLLTAFGLRFKICVRSSGRSLRSVQRWLPVKRLRMALAMGPQHSAASVRAQSNAREPFYISRRLCVYEGCSGHAEAQQNFPRILRLDKGSRSHEVVLPSMPRDNQDNWPPTTRCCKDARRPRSISTPLSRMQP
jgi:hypothetical protein